MVRESTYFLYGLILRNVDGERNGQLLGVVYGEHAVIDIYKHRDGC